LAGIDPVVAADRRRIGMTGAADPGAVNDFMDLFQPDKTAVDRVSKLGGQIDYVAFDSPVAFGWLGAYLDFATKFQQQTGERLSFMQADIIWYDNWRPQLVEWRRRLHEAGISYGVIFDGSSIDKSDLQWTTHAIERFRTVTGSPDTLPDDMVFQTWHSYPTHFLPDSRPGTLTSVVVQTVAAR
jgi:hypothetical protein